MTFCTHANRVHLQYEIKDMKHKVQHLLFAISVTMTFPVASQDFLPVENTCNESFISDLEALETTEPSYYPYYHYIASGGCSDVELKEGRFERITHHFAELGSLNAQLELSSDYSSVIDKAKAGSIPARAKIVLANIPAQTTQSSRTRALDDLPLTDELKQQYVEQILALADRGDIRALRVALAYYLRSPITLHGGDTDAEMAEYRINKARQLVERYGDEYLWLEMIYNNWLLEAKDIQWCVENLEENGYANEFEQGLYSYSRPMFCSQVFDKALFDRVERMSDSDRLRFFKDQLASLEFDFSGGHQARLDQLKKWDSALNKMALLAYFNVPLVKETLAYSLMSLPFEPSRDLAGFYWLDLDNQPSLLMRLISSFKGKNGYDVDKNMEQQLIPEILASKRYFGMGYLLQERFEEYYQFTLKHVVSKGDLPSLYSFYLMFKFDDNPRAWAMIKALEQYDPDVASQLKRDFAASGLSEPDEKEVAKVMDEISPYLPEQSQTHYSQLYWHRDIYPYLLKQITSLIELEERSESK